MAGTWYIAFIKWQKCNKNTQIQLKAILFILLFIHIITQYYYY